jgi:hypothetical protein
MFQVWIRRKQWANLVLKQRSRHCESRMPPLPVIKTLLGVDIFLLAIRCSDPVYPAHKIKIK